MYPFHFCFILAAVAVIVTTHESLLLIPKQYRFWCYATKCYFHNPDTGATEKVDTNLTDDYLFFTLVYKEGGDNVRLHKIEGMEGGISATWGGVFPSVTVQARGSNLTIYEFGAQRIPYSVEMVSLIFMKTVKQ